MTFAMPFFQINNSVSLGIGRDKIGERLLDSDRFVITYITEIAPRPIPSQES